MAALACIIMIKCNTLLVVTMYAVVMRARGGPGGLCDHRVSTTSVLKISLPSLQKQHVCVGNLLHLARILKVLRGVGSGPSALITAADGPIVLDESCVVVSPTPALTHAHTRA